MTVGTRSVMYGVHCLLIHPFFVAKAWWALYGAPRDIRLIISFILHDIGYLGCRNMEGAEGQAHVELGARIMVRLFGNEWGEFCRRHSRYYSRAHGLEVSRLCIADKLAFVITPAWLYLPMARASGELWEYMECARERQAGDASFTEEESAGLRSENPVHWLRALQNYTYRWVVAHCDVGTHPATVSSSPVVTVRRFWRSAL
jgi:hypothetical protein